jgi:hypothetical protein
MMVGAMEMEAQEEARSAVLAKLMEGGKYDFF